MHQIKIERARKLSSTGAYPATFDAMLGHVSAEIVSSVTSRQLARIIDDLFVASQAAKAIAEADAITEGAIWDARQQRLREIAA